MDKAKNSPKKVKKLVFFRINQSWFINGLETLALGITLIMSNHFIDRPPDFVMHIDELPFSIPIIAIGVYVMLASFHHLQGINQILVTFLPLFIWTFYFLMFLFHDIAMMQILGINRFSPDFTTMISFIIIFKILLEAFWSKSDW